MKINMTRTESGSEDGVTIREFGPGVVDVSESLAREFIAMGAVEAVAAKHGDEMPDPAPVEVAEGAAVNHPRQNKPRKHKGA